MPVEAKFYRLNLKKIKQVEAIILGLSIYAEQYDYLDKDNILLWGTTTTWEGEVLWGIDITNMLIWVEGTHEDSHEALIYAMNAARVIKDSL